MAGADAVGIEQQGLDFKRVRGGFLVQERFVFDPAEDGWRVATDRAPTDAEWNDLRFAWAAVAPVKSNASTLQRFCCVSRFSSLSNSGRNSSEGKSPL